MCTHRSVPVVTQAVSEDMWQGAIHAACQLGDPTGTYSLWQWKQSHQAAWQVPDGSTFVSLASSLAAAGKPAQGNGLWAQLQTSVTPVSVLYSVLGRTALNIVQSHHYPWASAAPTMAPSGFSFLSVASLHYSVSHITPGCCVRQQATMGHKVWCILQA